MESGELMLWSWYRIVPDPWLEKVALAVGVS
jgi:hypothetical protein